VTSLRRLLVLAVVAVGGCGPELPGASVDDPSLVQTARDVVALVEAYNCELLPRYLPTGAPEFFRMNMPSYLMDGMEDPVERVCFVLGVVQDYPRSETMEVRSETLTDDRADLLLIEGPLRADLGLVREGDRWKVDQAWALNQVQDLAVHQSLRMFAITQDQFYYYGERRFTDDYRVLSEGAQTTLEFFQGVAGPASQPMVLYGTLGPDAQSVCGSSRSLSGELFMIRAAGDGTASYARGTSLPDRCPGRRLRPSW
jgi:hypothetical protein